MAAIEKKIGTNLLKIRKSRGISQIELAERIGISFQQVQKYEKGVTRISVLRLQQLAEALEVPLSSFLVEESGPGVSGPTESYGQRNESSAPPELLDKEEILLLKLFRSVRNKKIREGLLRQLRGIAELENRDKKERPDALSRKGKRR